MQQEINPKGGAAKTAQAIGSDLPEGAKEYGKVKVGRFLSRSGLDSETYRIGVKNHRFFQAINYCDDGGNPITRICLVETPADRNWGDHHRALYNVMALLHEGEQAIRIKQRVDEVSQNGKAISLRDAFKLPVNPTL